MYRIMYMSTATEEFTSIELEELLEKAQVNNKKREVTGLLIVKGRTFIQCLEGEKDDVVAIYEKIEKDPRHKDIIELIEEDAESRYFPKWDMGYKNIRNLTNIESDKIKDLELEDFSKYPKEDIPQLFVRFVEDY